MDLALPPSLDLDKLLPDFSPAEQDSFEGQFDLFMGQEAHPMDAAGADQNGGSSGGLDDPEEEAAKSKHMSQKEKLRSKNRRCGTYMDTMCLKDFCLGSSVQIQRDRNFED